MGMQYLLSDSCLYKLVHLSHNRDFSMWGNHLINAPTQGATFLVATHAHLADAATQERAWRTVLSKFPKILKEEILTQQIFAGSYIIIIIINDAS